MRHDGPVVIALDGSKHGVLTLEWGLAEAERRKAAVVLARAYRDPPEFGPPAWYPAGGTVPIDAAEEAKAFLLTQLKQATTRSPGLVITMLPLHGSEVVVLRDLSRTAQLLVVGAHGYAGNPRRLGRVPAHLAMHALCPTAVVKEGPDEGAVVVGVDGSASSLAAAGVAAREATARGCPLVVLHAHPTTAESWTDERSTHQHRQQVDAARRSTEDLATMLRSRHPAVDVRADVQLADPADALVDASADASLVVVGSRGIGAFRGMLLGSVSAEVVRRAVTTVLVVHGEGPG